MAVEQHANGVYYRIGLVELRKAQWEATEVVTKIIQLVYFVYLDKVPDRHHPSTMRSKQYMYILFIRHYLVSTT
jgi:hypothetical protein